MDDLDSVNNKVYETEPSGVAEGNAGFSAQVQKDQFLVGLSEEATGSEDSDEDYEDRRTEEIIHKVVGFFERNKTAAIAAGPNFGMLLMQPPQSPSEAAGRIAIAAGMVGVGHVWDRLESKWNRDALIRREKIQARRGISRDDY